MYFLMKFLEKGAQKAVQGRTKAKPKEQLGQTFRSLIIIL